MYHKIYVCPYWKRFRRYATISMQGDSKQKVFLGKTFNERGDAIN